MPKRAHIDLNSNHSQSTGGGLFNKFLNSKFVPELHLPSYQYLGPFTDLEKRLKRGDPGINKLDEACKIHDIFYSKNPSTESRHIADQELENRAWERVLAPDSSFSEKAAAYLTTNAMKLKRKMGMGAVNPFSKDGKSDSFTSLLCKTKCAVKKRRKKKKKKKKKNGKKKSKKMIMSFGSLVRKARSAVKGVKEKDIRDASSLRNKVQDALNAVGSRKGIKKMSGSRIIPIPKSGGMLPLIPIIAGISKIGAIAGGASTIVNAIRDIINMRKSLKNNPEGQRQVGNGLFLAPYRKGYGLFLSPYPKN